MFFGKWLGLPVQGVQVGGYRTLGLFVSRDIKILRELGLSSYRVFRIGTLNPKR